MKNLSFEKEYAKMKSIENIEGSLYLVASEVRLLADMISDDYEEKITIQK